MKANAAPLLAVFEKKMRLEVPLFQRQYVWSKEQQWEPLWDDISRKFSEFLEGRKDAPVHFLGALVLDQRQTPTTHVEKRQVIDGQQRLTTLQIFLAAFRDFARENGCRDLADECDSFLLNRGMMAEPEVDRFKVWPTQLDRAQFADVVTSESKVILEKRHPLFWRKYARRPDPRPRMVEAYLFFYDQLREFFLGSDNELPLMAEAPLSLRMEECFQALRSALQVVVIDLDQEDDAQVIFETLNARGEPLLPADLLRNFIFLRAARAGEAQEQLYQEFWQRFDDPFWRTEIKQGRLSRPRSDLYLQHFLTSRQTVDIPVKHLFVEYKHWINKSRPFATVRAELETLARQGEHFRRMVEPQVGDVLFPLMSFLDAFDIRTIYPLLLHLLEAGLSEEDWHALSTIFESYLLRRSVCGLTTKNYNRVFLALTRFLRADGTSVERIQSHLTGLSGESTEWPTDQAFRSAWTTTHIYQTLQNPKIIHIFKRLNSTYLSSKHEELVILSPLTVEHIMPQSWIEQWPLPSGTTGLTGAELWEADPDDPRVHETKRRNALVQTIGNLTVLTQPLNSTLSNSAWDVKKPLLAGSLLPINQSLLGRSVWDEAGIEERTHELFDRALSLWPGPTP